MNTKRYVGLFPVVPTPFTDSGDLDLISLRRCIDFMIDAGSNGLCILANFSEQFLLSDIERDTIARTALEHVGGRVPVIVTTSHFSSRLCAERSRQAQDLGAALVMILPPYHGATLRVSEDMVFEFYELVAQNLRIPIVVQDAPISGTVLSVCLLARMAREIDQISYFKVEGPGATSKIYDLTRLGGDSVLGAWDGDEGITLLADLDAGATGAITGGGYPDGLRPILDHYHAGRRAEARDLFERWLPLINIENRQCGLGAAKALMKVGGIIECEAPRHPSSALHPTSRALLLETARRLDALVLRWAR